MFGSGHYYRFPIEEELMEMNIHPLIQKVALLGIPQFGYARATQSKTPIM
jgi:hypothetical protein